MFPFCQKKRNRMQVWGEKVAEGVHALKESAPVQIAEAGWHDAAVAAEHLGGAAAQALIEAGSQWRDRLGDTAGDVAQAGADVAHHAGQGVQSTLQHAGSLAGDTAEALGQTGRKWKKSGAEAVTGAVAALPRPALVSGTMYEDVAVHEGASKWLWLMLGMAAGATLAVVLMPHLTRKSVQEIKGRVDQLRGQIPETVAQATEAVADRAQEMAQVAEKKLSADAESEVDDAAIVEKVRTALGAAESRMGLERLGIASAGGAVTVTGQELSQEAREEIKAVVNAVSGVTGVEFQTEIEENDDKGDNGDKEK
jgi:hypothetical protein